MDRKLSEREYTRISISLRAKRGEFDENTQSDDLRFAERSILIMLREVAELIRSGSDDIIAIQIQDAIRERDSQLTPFNLGKITA